MRVGVGVSTDPDGVAAAEAASWAAVGGLHGEPAGLVLLFASPHHADPAEAILDAVHRVAAPAALIGCVGESIVGGSREIEGEPAVSVWAATLPDPAESFHMVFHRVDEGGAFAGWRFRGGDGGTAPPVHIVLADPFTFPADLLLGHLNDDLPGTPIVGGFASGGAAPGETILFRDREIHREGAVGVRLPASLSVRTFVSQGCRPIGQSFVVTRAEENFLFELGGRPPMERLRETVSGLSRADQELVSNGLHVGRVIDEYRAEFGTGDFLIRGVLGVDPSTGAIAVGDRIAVGETVQFHVRDAATADEELRSLLERERMTLAGGRAAGALLFTCNGRGSRMFASPDHDARLVSDAVGGAVAGFFCAGELGPVGGRNFVHGFTASLAIFVDDEPS
jgi:small ligand-binding sensory domain FIST